MYYYEHTDGSIQQKPDIVVDMAGGPTEYFNSPFVAKWWHGAPVVGWRKDEGDDQN